MNAHEVNFDGLVGPTHNYAGLAYGNLASQRYRDTVSNPRKAAMEALSKMKLLADLGVKQAVLPPHERPDVPTLRRLGFTGADADVLASAQRDAPRLLAACCSASSMWAANAATVAPSADTSDGRVHMTPANLTGNFHRSLEPPTTTRIFRAIFADDSRFVIHDPLPSGGDTLCDEGAANHTQFAPAYGERGIEFFVYGREATNEPALQTIRFRGRQTLEASRAVARVHQLDPSRTVFARQNQAAIDAGVFHNDVIAVGNLNVFLCHEQAYEDQPAVLEALRGKYRAACGGELTVIEVGVEEVSLAEAVDSYLFNSQLVSLPDGSMLMLCPAECQALPNTRAFLQRLAEVRGLAVRFVDVRQSMQNGGGPACLRLRVVVTDDELARIHPCVLFTDGLYQRLTAWVQRHYRESLRPGDLADPNLLKESRAALDELTGILGLGSLYEFQG